MNKIQQKYSAFMESVCTQFNCKQALPALKQGFKAFCESVDVDYDRVIIIFICIGVTFWNSSHTMYDLDNVEPRM